MPLDYCALVAATEVVANTTLNARVVAIERDGDIALTRDRNGYEAAGPATGAADRAATPLADVL